MTNKSHQVHVFSLPWHFVVCQKKLLIVAFQAIDLEPEEPVLRSSHRHDRRRHITRVLLLILQVVNSELAAKRQSSETSQHAVSFVAQHSRMMQRVLREASVGSLNGWEPGEKEAELAALVLSLVTCHNNLEHQQVALFLLGVLFSLVSVSSPCLSAPGTAAHEFWF